jgi:hypothetical protein
MTRTCSLAVGAAVLGLALAVSVSAQPRAPVVFEGTAIATEPNLPRCGDTAVAGWVEFRVERAVRGRVPRGLVRLVVGCPEMIELGARHRIEADTTGPRSGGFGIYGLAPLPPDSRPTFWVRRHLRLAGP